MTKLRDIQLSFQQSLLHRDDAVIEHIAKPLNMEAADRLQVYYNDYYFRLYEALKDDYAVCYQQIGDDYFESLVKGYLTAYPSKTYTIREIGYQFPIYLAECGEEAALVELARFECLMLQSLYAADVELLNMETLAALDPEVWVNLQLTLHPSVRQMLCKYNTLDVWLALNANNELTTQRLKQPVTAMIWRYENQAFFRALTAEEAVLFHGIAEGQMFATLCESMLVYFDEERVVEWVASVLQTWINDGILQLFNQ